MSVENLARPGNVLLSLSKSEDCFYCGGPLTSPAVHWSAPGGRITLHPACAKRLSIKLIYDAERAERIDRGDPLFSGIDSSFFAERNDV